MNKPNLLFYSITSDKCIELIKFMKVRGIDKNFKLVCVDNNTSNIVKRIKVIPTMIIPSINKVFTGNDVYLFITNKYVQRPQKPLRKPPPLPQHNTKQHQDNNQPQQQQEITTHEIVNKPETYAPIVNNNKNNNNNLIGYVEDEMSGLSDKYSYLDIDIQPIHNYGVYN